MEADKVIRLPLYRSNVVDDDFDHKLYWIDIIQDYHGYYTVYSYAQLFPRYGEPQSIRKYTLHESKSIGECMKYAKDKLRMKESQRGYREISKRDVDNVTASQETIIKFLQKYAK
jgi:hypothetical protein